MKRSYLWIALICGSFAAGYAVFAQPNGALDNTEVVWHSRDDEHLVELFTVGGRPINNDAGRRVKILVNTGYVVGYSEDRRSPLWAAYRASGLVGKGDAERFERSDFFSRDLRVLPAVDGRTFGDGHDRGHMVPNAAIATQYGSLAQMETFFMTNICAQKANLNQGPWMRLEHWIPEAADKLRHVFVISGPIFGDAPEIVKNGKERGIQIPDAFFMILVDTEREFQTKPKVRLLAYRFGQDTPKDADFKDREKFGTSIRAVEDATRLNFFPEFGKLFKDWDDRENEVVKQHWTLN